MTAFYYPCMEKFQVKVFLCFWKVNWPLRSCGLMPLDCYRIANIFNWGKFVMVNKKCCKEKHKVFLFVLTKKLFSDWKTIRYNHILIKSFSLSIFKKKNYKKIFFGGFISLSKFVANNCAMEMFSNCRLESMLNCRFHVRKWWWC